MLIEYTDTLAQCPQQLEWGVRSSAVIRNSPTSGAVSVTTFTGSRFIATIRYPDQTNAIQVEREVFWQSVGAQQNTVNLWHLMRPRPRGSESRVSSTTTLGITRGDTSVTVSGVAADGLLPGDMVGIGGELHMVKTNSILGGSFEVTKPIRADHAVGTAVVFDRPKAEFIVSTPELYIPYLKGGFAGAFTVSLVELF